jgi:RNA polymerase primary sigma factor
MRLVTTDGPIDRRHSPEDRTDAGDPGGRSCPAPEQVGTEARARQLLENNVEYVYDRRFDRPDAGATFLALPPAGAAGTDTATSPPAGLSPYRASLYGGATLLRPEEETYLFLRMNYLKHLAGQLRAALDPASATEADLDEIERLQGEIAAVKDRIIRANLRLVVSIVRRRLGLGRDFAEMVSDGNMGLIRAVDRFDAARGFKFSTYASHAIVRSLARAAVAEGRWRRRFVTGHPALSDATSEPRDDPRGPEADPGKTRESVRAMVGRLSDRERVVIAGRFALGGQGRKTLRQLGEEMGVTRERARQIQSVALERLRRLAREQGIGPRVA